MIEFIIGFYLGITIMCIFGVAQEVGNEEKKTSHKKKNTKKDKRT